MTVTDSNGKVTVELSSGASVEILHFGATVISWKSAGASTGKDEIKERFFLSNKSALDGSKPVSAYRHLKSCGVDLIWRPDPRRHPHCLPFLRRPDKGGA